MSTVKRVLEHVQRYGIETLPIQELLTLVLCGEGTSRQREKALMVVQRMMAEHTSASELLSKDEHELHEYGFDESLAYRMAALLQLTRRLSLIAEPRIQMKCPKDIADLVMSQMRHLPVEQMRVLVLDTKNCIMVNRVMYTGTVSSSVLRVAEVFRPAITRNASAIAVCHNHPSGDPVPSPEDIAITEQLVLAGKLLEIELVDHVIIGDGRYASLKEQLRW